MRYFPSPMTHTIFLIIFWLAFLFLIATILVLSVITFIVSSSLCTSSWRVSYERASQPNQSSSGSIWRSAIQDKKLSSPESQAGLRSLRRSGCSSNELIFMNIWIQLLKPISMPLREHNQSLLSLNPLWTGELLSSLIDVF